MHSRVWPVLVTFIFLGIKSTWCHFNFGSSIFVMYVRFRSMGDS